MHSFPFHKKPDSYWDSIWICASQVRSWFASQPLISESAKHINTLHAWWRWASLLRPTEASSSANTLFLHFHHFHAADAGCTSRHLAFALHKSRGNYPVSHLSSLKRIVSSMAVVVLKPTTIHSSVTRPCFLRIAEYFEQRIGMRECFFLEVLGSKQGKMCWLRFSSCRWHSVTSNRTVTDPQNVLFGADPLVSTLWYASERKKDRQSGLRGSVSAFNQDESSD